MAPFYPVRVRWYKGGTGAQSEQRFPNAQRSRLASGAVDGTARSSCARRDCAPKFDAAIDVAISRCVDAYNIGSEGGERELADERPCPHR